MLAIIYVIPVLLIIILSVIIVKIAAVMLAMTGLDSKKAHFQALSAFTGTGFTTKESELILEVDLRRRIIMTLMVLGNAGLITVIIALVLGLVKTGSHMRAVSINFGIIIIVLYLLYRLATHKKFSRLFTKKVEEGLAKRPPFRKRPVEEILRVAKDYGVAEVTLKETCKDLGKTLGESSFRGRDILVIAIERKDGFIPAPKASDTLEPGDTIICYGKLENIEKMT